MEAETAVAPSRPVRRKGGRPTNAERAAKAAALETTKLAQVPLPPVQPVAPQQANAGLGALQIERPEMREPMRDESPRERADRIAAEWFSHLDGLPAGRDKYYVAPDRIPDGWSYEWKTLTVVGKENPQYQVELQRSGWVPVPAKRHPEMMPTGFKGVTIEIDGMRLMERPAAITAFQKARDERSARAPVQNIKEKLSGAPPGHFERGTHPGAPVAVNTAFGPPEIPKS